jgi:hypothetical protein
MNCYYCQQPMYYTESVNAKWFYYHCIPCDASFDYSNVSNCVEHYRFVKEHLIAYFYPLKNEFVLFLSLTKKYVEFDFIPNFTPSNILQKHKTLLTFL